MKHLFLFIFGIGLQTSLALAEDKNYEHLISTIEIFVEADGSSKEVYEDVYRVINDAGRSELAIQNVRFDGANTKFKVLEAYTLSSGKKIPASPSTIKISALDMKVPALTNFMQATIPFDSVLLGSEIHLKYELSKDAIMKNIFADIKGASSRALAKTEYVKYISATPLLMFAEKTDGFYETSTENSGGKQTVTIKPTPKAYSLLGISSSEVIFYLTTAKTWKEVRELQAPLYKKEWNVKLPEKLETIARTLKPNKDRGQQIDQLALEIKKLVAYSGDWSTQQGKFQPSNIKKTLFKGKGDCKDYSTVMTAVLRNLGFEAYPLLTFRSQNYLGETRLSNMAKIPNPAFFNHVIVWAKDPEGKIWWVDPTNPYVKSDVITSDILGNFGLLLDDKATDVTFLPKSNSQPSDFKFEHCLQIQPDNSIIGSGEMNMSPSSYNGMELLAQSYGPDILAKAFALILNPLSKDTKVTVKRDATPLHYGISYHSTDWVAEELGKFKGITLFNSVGILLEKFKPNSDIDLGEPGTSQVITRIRNQKEIDSIRANCLIRSKWLDVDRYVVNNKDEIVVTDIAKTKVRFIAKEETIDNDYFDQFFGSLRSCAKNAGLIFYLDNKLKTAQHLEEEKHKGPPVEQMTDKDAVEIENSLGGPGLYSYLSLKLYRYNETKLNLNKLDAEGAYQMAVGIRNLGYLSGDKYIPEHLEEALKYAHLSIKKSEKAPVAKYYSFKMRALLYQKRIPEAIATFNELYKLLPKDVYTYRSAVVLAQHQNKIAEGEAWAKHFKASSKTLEELETYNSVMFSFYSHQAKYKESIPFAEYLAKQKTATAWDWHNLALMHYNIQEFDKCIDYEKKALAISEFGAAKHIMAKAYEAKSFIEMELQSKSRAPASTANVEKYLLESLKYDSQSYSVLTNLARIYLVEFEKTKNKDLLSKGEAYLKRASDANSKGDKAVNEIAAAYAKYKNIR